MKRAIVLQTLATKKKISILKKFSLLATSEYNRLLPKRSRCKTFMQFHHKTFSTCKKNTSFNVQVICSLIRDVWRKNCKSAKSVCVKFNVPRNCKTFSTKSNFFIRFGIIPFKRVAVPIKQNRNYQRFQALISNDWTCKTYGLLSNGNIIAYLSKTKEIPQRKNMLGIDINAKHFAVSILSVKGKILYQTYFGRHIWAKRKKIMQRRAYLQSIKAKKALAKLRTKELDFVNTNLGQVVREIIKLAKRFDADIAIEKLRKFKSLGRKANKIIMRIPFCKFKEILQSRCFDNEIKLNIVDSWHTSKWCSHCGAAGKGHSANYSLFKCKCGQIVNSDRKASLAVAVKSLLERKVHVSNQNDFFQFSNRRVPVNGLMRPYENVGVAVHNHQLLRKSQRHSAVG